MTIEAYQVNNVLRTYGNSFREGKINQMKHALGLSGQTEPSEDKVTISQEAKDRFSEQKKLE